MAKQKKKKPKISTGDAIKILANDSKLAKQHIINTQQMCRDYFSLFELYMTWKGDSEEFLKHVQQTVEERQKEFEDGAKPNEPADEKDTGGSVKNEEVGAE